MIGSASKMGKKVLSSKLFNLKRISSLHSDLGRSCKESKHFNQSFLPLTVISKIKRYLHAASHQCRRLPAELKRNDDTENSGKLRNPAKEWILKTCPEVNLES
jgi:hypothetical protein